MATSGRLKEIEREWGESLCTLIPRLIEQHKTPFGVAPKLGVTTNTIRHWLESNDYFFNKETKKWEKRPDQNGAVA